MCAGDSIAVCYRVKTKDMHYRCVTKDRETNSETVLQVESPVCTRDALCSSLTVFVVHNQDLDFDSTAGYLTHTFVAKKDSLMRMSWDNSHSYFTARQLLYSLQVITTDGQTRNLHTQS